MKTLHFNEKTLMLNKEECLGLVELYKFMQNENNKSAVFGAGYKNINTLLPRIKNEVIPYLQRFYETQQMLNL